MIFSLVRGEENVPEKRRPSCLSMVTVKGTLLSRGSVVGCAAWRGIPARRTIDSLLPFQVPRRSGIALCCAAAGAAERVANTTIQASFDMAQILQAFMAPLFPVKSPYRDQRGDGREQEERGKKAPPERPTAAGGQDH